MKPESSSQESAENDTVTNILTQLRAYVRDMDARIHLARAEINEQRAAADQLEKEKWDLDREIDRLEKLFSPSGD